ncbi:hypothetical protein J2Z60_001071 [Lactobacillus colini]|uniref:DUF3277 family protein n=1 Tax=Lactobacillus colini TaxID=1819254 RepID=A0ABS4ME18_9LACO|nr:DUF3277 family protein [Lactobacillus colini]MBP2057896.1 hypothetical protein [Lactobacillus colini]
MANANSPQTGLMATFNGADSTIVVDGNVMVGYAASGDIVQVTWDNDRVSVDTDVMGTSVASQNNKTSATMTLNLNQMSPSNKVLIDLYNRGVNGQNFAVDVRNSAEHVYGTHCYIAKMPEVNSGEKAGTRAWQIHLLNAEIESILD